MKKDEAKRTATAYLVIERDGRSRHKPAARIVKHATKAPDLAAGQCAVRVTIELPDAAFEPLLVGPKLSFDIDETVRATITKADGEVG